MLVGVGVDGGGHGRPPGNSLSNEYLCMGSGWNVVVGGEARLCDASWGLG